MKAILLSAALCLALTACGQRKPVRTPSAAAPEPARYTYIVHATHPHPTDSYTQGLQLSRGVLWEGTGVRGESRLLRYDDLSTGKPTVVARLPRAYFGEGITLLDGKIYMLTWQSNTAFVYDAATGRLLERFNYPGEGWGLTSDGEKLYMSDGTSHIHVHDPVSFRRERSIAVTFKGRAASFLNELEWIDGKIWANVYTTDLIVIIDPKSGSIEGVVDLSGLLPEQDRTPDTDVLNGIAYDPTTGRLLVTGKNWSKLFEIEIAPL